MKSEAAEKADFTGIRYAQCWEDADILIPALNLKPGAVVLSIASAGDNTFSILSQSPKKVYAIDLSGAQLACVEFRKAAYKKLDYEAFLEVLGVKESSRRLLLFEEIGTEMSSESRLYWEAHMDWVEQGIINVGKFEQYFQLFSRKVLPLVHGKKKVEQLLMGGTENERADFYDRVWNNTRWRLLFKLFFSRQVMGRFGRDPSFFDYVEGSVADRILMRTEYALKDLNPAENPYLHWIIKGRYGKVLPHALRREHFDAIKANVDALEIRKQSMEDFVAEMPDHSVNAFNLSDIFEYMSTEKMEALYGLILKASAPKARLAYWNMLAPRACPEPFKNRVVCLKDEAQALFKQDKAFFYNAFKVEEVQ